MAMFSTPLKQRLLTSTMAAFLPLAGLSNGALAADYPPNIDYGSQGDFVAKRGTEYGRTADLNLVGPLLVNLPEAPGSTSNGIPWQAEDTVWDLSDLTNPTLIRSLTCDTCYLGSPIFAHATVIRFDNDDAYLYTRGGGGNEGGDHMTYNPQGATSNEQAVTTNLNWGYDPMSYPMLFSPYHLRRWWDYGDDPSGNQWIRDPSRLLPEGEDQRWLGEILVEWDHIGLTGVTGFAAWLGNLVVMSSDQQSTGMAIYDVSGFKEGQLPRLLSTYQPTLTEPDGNQVGIGGYWVEPYGTTKMVWAARQRGGTPERHYPGMFVVDFTDPTDPQLTCALFFDQDRDDPADGDESSDPMYVNFQDQYAYVDHFRVDIPGCEQAYANDQTISDTEFAQVVYRFDDINNSCDGSQYFRPLGQVGIFGGYDWWRTQAIIRYSGGELPVSQYLQNQSGLGFEVIRHLEPGLSVVNTTGLQVGDTVTTNDTGFTINEMIIDERINEQGMCFMVTSDEPDTTAPYVSGHRPLANQVNYPVDGFIHIHIPETLRTETVTDAVTVTNIETNETVSYRHILSHTGTLAIWPDQDLALNTTYRVDVAGIQDFMGNTMTPYQFEFSTGAELIGDPVPDPDTSPSDDVPDFSGTPFYPIQSSQLACAPDQELGNVWVVNPDNDSVSILAQAENPDADVSSLSVEREIKLNYQHPTSVTRLANQYAVTYQHDDKVVFFDTAGNPQRAVDTGHGSQPISSVSDGSHLYVALYGAGEVVKINLESGVIEARQSVGSTPKAMALSDGRLLVTRFISSDDGGEVYDINTAGSMTLTRTIAINKVAVPDDIDHGMGLPNYLNNIVINPDQTRAYITAVKANIDRGLHRNGQALDDDNTVRPMLVTLDLENHRDLNTNPTTRDGTLDLDNAADPYGVSFLPDGVTRVHTLQGNNLAVLNNLSLNTTANLATGFAPQSVCTTVDTLFVKNFTDRSVSAIDISGWMYDGRQNPDITQQVTVAQETLTDEELAGLKLFYHARVPDIAPEGYISCASCHAGGGHDGRTWDMTHMGEGVRNTLSLNGASGTRFGDLHWSANFDEVEDFEIQLERLNGATGLVDGVTFQDQSPLTLTTHGLSNDLDALAAYVNGLGKDRVARSPHRSYSGELTATAMRGQQVFAEQGCDQCHAGAAFRDGQSHDVGTITAASGNRLGIEGGLTEIRTPSLIELWDSAPYFHNGNADTLSDVLSTGQHSVTLSTEDQASLIEFLLSIDRELYIEDDASFPDF
ncbi:Ig-like domain-containing protein [Litoribacillus peritrichatus]|uniref:Cytochrome c domain-containing protein n=1 Tax=Litoribacillus peritrichatus TaxID=718191 RepID=A0ABP7MUN8_9GAMM